MSHFFDASFSSILRTNIGLSAFLCKSGLSGGIPRHRPSRNFFLWIVLPVSLQLSSCVSPGSGSTSCYNFSVVHESCSLVQAINWGCDGGREYQWTDRCLGWFDIYHPGPIQKCFNQPLEDQGACTETKSLPPGGKIP